jgi:hypothetical protein
MADEAQTPQAAQTEGAAAKKNSKINRLTTAELNSKIAAFEQSNQTKSKYYKHLLERRQEIQPK